MAEPLVSVIVPTFNRGYCLERTVRSALAQTHRRLEVLVIDDGSTDDTRDVVAALAVDPRVRYIWQENQHVSAARNMGLRHARGAYIAFLDSDDVWMPWKLELQLACMEASPEIGMTWTDMDAVDPEGRVTSRLLRTMYSCYASFSNQELFAWSRPLREVAPRLADHVGTEMLRAGDVYTRMIMGSLVHTSTVVIRRDRARQVGEFDRGLRLAGEDYDFHLRTCRYGPVALVDVSTMNYQRGMPDRLTRPSHRVAAAANFLAVITRELQEPRAQRELSERMKRHVLADAHGWLGGELFDRGDRREARHHLAAAVRHGARDARLLRLLCASMLPDRAATTLRRTYQRIRSRAPQPASAS